MDLDCFSPEFWARAFSDHEPSHPGPAKDRWNAKAPGFARKQVRSGYIGQLIDRMALAPGETVFDMGCGPGTLALPLAQAGHRIVAVDFSPGMLAELHAKMAELGDEVAARVSVHERAWADDWSDLPEADIAVSSRSLITDDLADSIAKLESKARRRVVVTTIGGETPWIDLRVLEAIGRDVPERCARRGMVALVNYLFAIGRRPKVDYLVHQRRPRGETVAEITCHLRDSIAPATDAELRALDAFLEEHLAVDGQTGCAALDYEQQSVWAYIEWDVPQG